MTLDDALAQTPIVAILRGVTPDEIVAHAEALLAEGVQALEIPLNSPDPLVSVERARAALGERAVVGAGTVLEPSAVEAAARSRAQFIVSPNTDPAVIGACVRCGLPALPGFGTASEAFAALAAGANLLKLFPASTYGPGHLRALTAVLPPGTPLYPVGGVGPPVMAEWLAAGASGFGLGSDLYRPGQSPDITAERARACVGALGEARAKA